MYVIYQNFMKKLSPPLIILIAFTTILASSCTNTQNATAKIQVATSFYPLYFFTQQIGGEKIEVINITPPGGEPHEYELTAQDIVRIENSTLLVLAGGGLESWGEKIQQNIDPQKTTILMAGEDLMTQDVVEEDETITDPHVWLSPVLAQKMADKIAVGLMQADPANATYYQANTDILKITLSNLDTEYRQGLSQCASKNIITAHAAFGYLASTYGLNQVSISGLSTEEEPSPQQLAEVAQFAQENGIKYIFFESLVSPELSETIATEIGAQTLVLNPLEGLTATEITEGKNYITEMQNNLHNLQIALQCTL